MLALRFFLLVASVAGQATTLTGTGAISWTDSAQWSAGVPTGNFAVTVATDAQVTVNSAVNFASSTAALTLGATTTTGTQLIINATTFTVFLLTWTNGWIVGQANGQFAVSTAATLGGATSGSQDRQLVGGWFSALAVNVNGGGVSCNGAGINGNAFVGTAWTINTGGWLNFSASSTSWLAGSISFSGGGSINVWGEAQANGTVTFGNGGVAGVGVSPAWVWIAPGGNFTLSGSGSATVSGGSSLVVAAGGRLKRWQAQASAQLSIAASATLEFAAGTTSWLDANIQNAGNFVVDAGAQTTVSASSTISGAGSYNISGSLNVGAALTISTGGTATVYSGGTINVAAGVAATFCKTTFNSGSQWKLNFPSSGSFAAVTFNDALNFNAGATLYVDVPVQPTATVVLATATSISGSFSGNVVITANGAAGRRLLTSGSVSQNGNQVTYTPSGNSAATKSIAILPMFAMLALW